MTLVKRNPLSRFGKDIRGNTVVEFAFVLPILLFFIFGIIEFSMVFMAANVLENAASTGTRTGKTGFIDHNISREQTIRNTINQRLAGFLNPAKITIVTRVYKAFGDIGKPEPYVDRNNNHTYDTGETFTDVNSNGHWDSDMGTTGLGVAGEIVVYEISYPWQVMTPFLSEILADNGLINLTSHIVVRNEPYG
jgi:hypothetical protein